MAKVWKYKNKRTNENMYAFKVYLGTDPATGRYVQTTRRGFRTSKEAKQAAELLRIKFSKGEYKRETPKTFDDLYKIFFDQYQKRVKESSLSSVIETYKNQIKPFLADKRLDHITPIFCQKMVDKWSQKHKVFAHYRALTNQIFNYGIRMEICKENPMKKTVLPKNNFGERKANFYDREELKYFFKCLKSTENAKSYAAFRILAMTGMRKGEMLALTWSDIDFDNKLLTVSKTVSEDRYHSKIIISRPKTKNSNRTITIDNKTIQILREWKIIQAQELFKKGIHLSEDKQLIIPNKNNTTYRPPHFNRYLYELYREFPDLKQITVHGFRHTHASLLFESGATIKEVQQRLGHKDIKTTMDIYTHVTKESERNVAEKFANFLNF